MTQPDPNAPVHIPGLITAAGTVTPPLPATAQPNGGTLPPGTMTAGAIPAAPQVQTMQTIQPPALPQAGAVVPHLQIDPALAAQYLASQQSQPPAPQVQQIAVPAPVAPAPQPVLPTAIPQYAQPQQVAVPGLTAPVAVPPAQPTSVLPPPPAPVPAPLGEPDGLTDGDGKPYPEGKPLAEMTDAEGKAYYKWYSRQWENRSKAGKTELDQLRNELTQLRAATPAVPANDIEQRINAARQEAYQQAAAAAAVTLVDAHVRAGLQTRLQPHQVEALASGLNHQHFLSADGRSVDADKVSTFVNTVAPVSATTPAIADPAATAPATTATPGALPTGVPIPAPVAQPATGLPRQLPDLGQGNQPAAPLDKLTLGRQQAQAFLAGNI